MFGLALLAIATRLPYLFSPLHCDEAVTYTWYCVGKACPVWHVFRHYPTPNNHVLHSLLVTSMYAAFGCGFPWLRLPAMIAGIICVPYTFVVMRRIVGGRSAVVAAIVLCVSAWAMRYSVEARGYSLAMLLGLASLHLAWRAVHQRRTRTMCVAGVAAGLAIYTVPTAIHCVAAIFAWLMALAVAEGKSSLRDRVRQCTLSLVMPIVAGATSAILYGPMISYMGVEGMTRYGTLQPLSMSQTLWALPAGLREAGAMLVEGPMPGWLLWSLAFVGLAALCRARSRSALLFLSMLLVPIGLEIVTRRIPPARTLTFLLPHVSACVAVGIVASACWIAKVVAKAGVGARRWSVLRAVSMIGLAVATLAYYGERWPFPRHGAADVRPVVSAVADQIDRGAFVYAQTGVAENLQYYLAQSGANHLRAGMPQPGDYFTEAVVVAPRLGGLGQRLTTAMRAYRADALLFASDDYEIWRVVPVRQSVATAESALEGMP